MRIALALVSLLLFSCVRARELQAEEHLRNEFNFLVPFVDLEAEEKEVRKVLAQRKLIVDETLRGDHFVALSASTLDLKRTAVRIITGRGVVAGEDGDVDELFGPSKVALSSLASGGPGPDMLLGIAKTERGHDLGCAQFFRVRPDANLVKVDVHLERFGSRACLAALRRAEAGGLVARVGWPSLSAGIAPTLFVDMRIDSGRLDQADPDQISLRIASEEAPFVARESARLEALLAQAANFPERQAGAVARAALALCANENADQQLASYQRALGNAAASGLHTDLIALTREHIEHGWDDLVPEAQVAGDGGTPATPGDEAPDPRDNVIIEPAPAR